jgi:hypothetical protein
VIGSFSWGFSVFVWTTSEKCNANIQVGMSSPSLDVLGVRCKTSFHKIYALLVEPGCSYGRVLSPVDVKDELGRFKIWAENIGAFQPIEMKSSLEYRLRDASRTRQQALNFIQDLDESLNEGSTSYLRH